MNGQVNQLMLLCFFKKLKNGVIISLNIKMEFNQTKTFQIEILF